MMCHVPKAQCSTLGGLQPVSATFSSRGHFHGRILLLCPVSSAATDPGLCRTTPEASSPLLLFAPVNPIPLSYKFCIAIPPLSGRDVH